MNFPNEEYEKLLKALEQAPAFQLEQAAARILPLIDLTSLSEEDSVAKIADLCRKARTPYGAVAAVCVFTRFVSFAKSELIGSPIKVATVANFPTGNVFIDDVVLEIEKAIVNGADEVDIVWPYQAYLSQANKVNIDAFLTACRKACGVQVHLKIILETGVFPNVETIYDASRIIIDHGANFIKTSTGKIKIGATLEAACAMLLAIRDSSKSVGFKASGGIRTTEQAAKYLWLADQIMGADWVSAETFRFGASALLQDVLDQMKI